MTKDKNFVNSFRGGCCAITNCDGKHSQGGGLAFPAGATHLYLNRVMNARIALLWVFVLVVTCVAGAETKTYYKSETPRTLSDWRDSKDGKISLCFAVDKTTFTAKEKLIVRGALRNNTDKPITILSPFGDTFYAQSSGITILGPEGNVPYRGAIKDYMLGTSSFVEIPAQSVVDETMELPRDLLPDLGKPGLYKLEYLYTSGGYPKQPPPENFWTGEIKGATVHILVR